MITIKTIHKIFLARFPCSFILGLRKIQGKSEHVIAKRGGLLWNLDLKEGIDFSIYLLGGFEPYTLKLYTKIIKPGDIVLDIGANVGSHTLPLARLVGEQGRVIAFEPTKFALDKLHENIQLNKDLCERISLHQMMLVASDHDSLDPEIYSSWPLFNESSDLHKEHRGQLMKTTGAVVRTLDTAIRQMNVPRIDFIKIDVDGHEFSVISGGMETLMQYRPVILMEFAPHLFRKNNTGTGDFEQLVTIFHDLGYSAFDVNSKIRLPLLADQLKKMIPAGGSRNVLLYPSDKPQRMTNMPV
jgi:FkbM family methyltransferase